MTVAVLVPFGGSECPYRNQAYRWVTDRYRRLHGNWEVLTGSCDQPWSKGAAVTDAYRQTDADVLVIADADSYIADTDLNESVDHVATGRARWVVPHLDVYRLDEAATADVYNGQSPDRRRLVRPAYRGVLGGGITILTREAYETVGGIDPRFEGWGGEDVCFGWALRALVGNPTRHRADFWHLYHPHPAPDLRGSLQSEALVAEYRNAHRSPPQMRRLIDARGVRDASEAAPETDRHDPSRHPDRPARRDGRPDDSGDDVDVSGVGVATPT